uniref:(northern house mosquito) hypothetical protein n=1 Tax=Culex pipiens TaxID=7175 RepID=A0A8D8BAW6_CULPI
MQQITISAVLPAAALLLLLALTIPGGDAYYSGGYASVHSGGHGGLYDMIQPGPAQVLTFPGTVPLPKCGHALFLKCHKRVREVPCVPGGYGGHLGGYAASTGAYGAAPQHYASPHHGGSY